MTTPGFTLTRRRMRRRFLRRLTAPRSQLYFLVTDGALNEKQAWRFYEDAFWDGIFDEMETRHRRDAEREAAK